MREIEKLANELFDGDIPKAIDYAYRNWGSTVNDKMKKIYDEFTPEDKKIACEVIRNLAIERSGKKAVERFERSINKTGRLMNLLNMSDEEILNSSKNPFKKICFTLIISLGVVILVGSFISASTFTKGETIISALIALISILLVPNMIKYFQFKKAKKLLLEIDIETETDK